MRARREVSHPDLAGPVLRLDPVGIVGQRWGMDETRALANRSCVPCKGGVPPLAEEAAAELLGGLDPSWKIVDGHHLERAFAFPDFVAALGFANRVGALAEENGHHPDLHISWGKVVVTIWTHKINGLTESDFILAAKIDRLP